VAVTSLGLVSCISHDVISSCAAERASLTRRTPLAATVPGDEGEEVPVVGAPIAGFTDGFLQSAAWLRMAPRCIEDLITYGKLPGKEDAAFWQGTTIAWLLPEIGEDARFGWPENDIPMLLDESLGKPFLAITGLPLKGPVTYFRFGAAGLHRAIAHAYTALTKIPRVLLLATESLVDGPSLSWLAGEERLKDGEHPTGMCPGEAAVALLLEEPRAARARAATSAVQILASTSVASPAPLDPVEPSADRFKQAPDWGRNLGQAIRDVLMASGTPLPFRGDFVLDLNGESWKAMIWGTAQTQLVDVVDFPSCPVRLPAVSFGDVGAASSLVGVCVAARAFARRYALGQRAVICSMSDCGEVSAVVVGAPG